MCHLRRAPLLVSSRASEASRGTPRLLRRVSSSEHSLTSGGPSIRSPGSLTRDDTLTGRVALPASPEGATENRSERVHQKNEEITGSSESKAAKVVLSPGSEEGLKVMTEAVVEALSCDFPKHMHEWLPHAWHPRCRVRTHSVERRNP